MEKFLTLSIKNFSHCECGLAMVTVGRQANPKIGQIEFGWEQPLNLGGAGIVN